MKKTILIVDDFNSIQKFLCKTLENKGYTAIGAPDGNEAYQLLIENPGDIHLVLSDLNMPNCTGMELLHKIKSNPETSGIPVIFLTTETDPVKMRHAKEADLFAWIRKPYQAEYFFAQIENAISNGH